VDSGFTSIKITRHEISRDLVKGLFPDKNLDALDYVVSAYIEAEKPLQAVRVQ